MNLVVFRRVFLLAIAPFAHAITLPDFPPSPIRFEVPAGSAASAFIPMPGMCPDTGDGHGVFHGQVGKPLQVPHQRPRMGQQMMAQQHRLGVLKMGPPGHDRA